MKSLTHKIYCAFCRLQRTVYVKKSIDWTNVLLSFFAASVLMFFLWQRLDGRMIIFFVFFAIGSEIFVRIRWRMGLRCPHCHFDPLLYKVDRVKAMNSVKTYLSEVRGAGRFVLKQNNPFQHLPVIKINPDTKRAKTIS